MSETVIRVENLGKKYIIGQQRQEKYTTLRDKIAHSTRLLSEQLLAPLGKKVSDSPYQEFWALQDISFEVKQGDRVGVIGRNGAGKSTLLKILSRITEPTTGRITIRGRVASLLEVGTGFHPELTGRENIYLNGAILGMGKAEIRRKFDEIVTFAEVETFLDTPVKRYSSGMYVRLAFAVAAHLEPEILVVDEVLAVGDIAFQRKCLGKMDDVAKEGRTVFFVSHNMASIRKLCQVGYWLDGGRLRQNGAIDEVVDLYEKEALEKPNFRADLKAINQEYGIEVNEVNPLVYSNEKEMTLKIEIRGFASKPISQLGVAIQLTTLEGVLISKIWPRMAGSWLENLYGDWRCVFEYPNISHYLGSGDYVVHLVINKPQIGALLKVEDAALVHIPPTDVYGVGIYFDVRQHGIVPLPVIFSSSKA